MLPTEVILNEAFTSIIQIFDAYIQGESRLHILEFALNSTQTFIFLWMPVLSTIVQKGGDCKSKVLPP